MIVNWFLKVILKVIRLRILLILGFRMEMEYNKFPKSKVLEK